MSYYDLDDILAEQTVTTVVLRTGILGLGYLEPGNPNEDLAAGAKLQLPLWMSQVLQQESYCTLETPQPYGRVFGSAIGAGPKTTQLSAFPYWYEVGIKVARVLPEQSERIAKMLNSAFAERYVDIFTRAQNWRDEDATGAKKIYTRFEQHLYQGEYVASTLFEKWKDRPATRIEASELAQLDEHVVDASAVTTDMERDGKRQKTAFESGKPLERERK